MPAKANNNIFFRRFIESPRFLLLRRKNANLSKIICRIISVSICDILKFSQFEKSYSSIEPAQTISQLGLPGFAPVLANQSLHSSEANDCETNDSNSNNTTLNINVI